MRAKESIKNLEFFIEKRKYMGYLNFDTSGSFSGKVVLISMEFLT